MNKNLDNFMCAVGNIFLFSAMYYAVFFLNHSGWWFAFLLIFHFRTEQNK